MQNSFFQSKSGVKRCNWVNFSHFETLNSTSRRLSVTICSVTAGDIMCHRITVVHNAILQRVTFSIPTLFEEEKVKHPFSGSQFLSKSKDFNNGNSLRMTEQEDISYCYFMIEETWSC